MDAADIERTSLDAHVSLCELRYENLAQRLDRVETQLADLHTVLYEIRDTLARQPQYEDQRWSQFQWWLIAVLLGVCSWLGGQVFFA